MQPDGIIRTPACVGKAVSDPREEEKGDGGKEGSDDIEVKTQPMTINIKERTGLQLLAMHMAVGKTEMRMYRKHLPQSLSCRKCVVNSCCHCDYIISAVIILTWNKGLRTNE